MAPRNWIVSAFDPFLDRPINHSIQVMEKVIELNRDPGLKLFPLVLPTQYDLCDRVLIAEIRRLKSLGVALTGVLSIGEGKEEFKIETQANNLDHSPSHADNAGIIRAQQKIFPELPDLIPLRFAVEHFAIDRSVSPGFFVCNHLCAKMGVAGAFDPSLPPFGFVHVPRSDLATKYPTETCARAILSGILNFK